MKKEYIVLFFILILSSFLRLYKLDQNPPSLYWDEASLGYNAFSILTTGHDEHGEVFPVTRFIAFGDYKPPGYIYAIVPWMAIFGVNEFAIRFPSAASGIIMVLLSYLLGKKLFDNQKIALIAALLLAVSPWSLQLSRAAFEAHLAAVLELGGIYLFLCAKNHHRLLPVSALLFVVSFYTFNANRIIAPLIILLLFVIYRAQVWQAKRTVFISIILAVVILWPNVAYLQTRESRLRFQEVSIFTSLDVIKKANGKIEKSGNAWWAKIIHNRRIYFAREFLLHFVDHFKGEYLFIKGDQNPRLSIQDIGELYLFELPFLMYGGYLLLLKRDKNSALLFGWLLFAHIPAATARETPHMLRTASVLPTYQLITAFGIVSLATWWTSLKRKTITFPAAFVMFVIVIVSLFYYFHNYWVHYPRDWSGEWQYGYKQLAEKVKVLEPNYDRVLVTQNLGRPYIYFLLYNKINPLEYVRIRSAERDWYGLWNVYGFGKYDFLGKSIETNEKILKVGTSGAFANSGKKLDEVRAPDGKVVFEIGEP